MSRGYLLVHDLGTTANKAALFDENGRLVASASAAYATHHTRDGGAEQNPQDWLAAVCSATREVVARSRIEAKKIEGISLSGHMMGVVALGMDAAPLRPAILHSDIRSSPQARAIATRISSEQAYNISGNPLDVHYPLSKLAWLRENEPDTYNSAVNFVQSKDFVSAWLTDEKSGRNVQTDFSDASLYGCFDFESLAWSPALCDAASLAMDKLPPIVEVGCLLGSLSKKAAQEMHIVAGTPVYSGFGDGAAAALGADAWSTGACYGYVGSTSWIAATTASPLIDPDRRLFTLALTAGRFSSIGTVQSAGAAWEWAVDLLCDSSFDEAEALASSSVPGANALVFLPYLSGERAPIWNDRARGVWLGLTESHNRADLLRSVLDGVCVALSCILGDIKRCTGSSFDRVKLIGGGLRSSLWRQALTSALNCQTEVFVETSEATARGAMLAVALGAGIVSDFDEGSKLQMMHGQVLEPDKSEAEVYKAIRPIFASAYTSLVSVFDDLASVRRQSLTEPGGTMEVTSAPF
ncbi:MAG: hypothetical protein IT209_13500 [Armatimonadetes bacterium]|nr:hypothetical protein [Armatimonadota bacterium]